MSLDIEVVAKIYDNGEARMMARHCCSNTPQKVRKRMVIGLSTGSDAFHDVEAIGGADRG